MSGAGSADVRRAIASGKPVLLEFSATWCGPCRMVRPEVEALSGEVGDKARVVMLDVDKSPEIGQAYGVRGIPCFIVLKDGKEASRMVGAIPKSEMRRMLGL